MRPSLKTAPPPSLSQPAAAAVDPPVTGAETVTASAARTRTAEVPAVVAGCVRGDSDGNLADAAAQAAQAARCVGGDGGDDGGDGDDVTHAPRRGQGSQKPWS